MDFNNSRWLCLQWDERGPRFQTYSEEQHFRYNNKILLKEINFQKENKKSNIHIQFPFYFLNGEKEIYL